MLNSSDPQPKVVPVIEEEMHVHRLVEEAGAVRVRIHADTRAETVDTSLTLRGVSIERVARNVVADKAKAPWHEGETLVVPVYQEVVVKQLMLVEEIRMTPTVSTQSDTTLVELKSETPIFERRDAAGKWNPISASEL